LRLLSTLTLTAMLATTAAMASDYPVTVKSCNRDVTFDAAPTRAVSNDVNLTEMMLALGLTDHMVGIPASPSGRHWTKLCGPISSSFRDCRPTTPPRKCCSAPMPTSTSPAGTTA
jgi:hypothetical protein